MAGDIKLTVRLAGQTDAQIISNIHVRSRSSAYRGQLPDNYLDSQMPAESLTFWPDRIAGLEAGDGISFIAELSNKPVGFICLECPDSDRSCFVDNLHTLPEHRGCGVGGLLLNVASKWAISCSAIQMHLLVLATNEPAIRFYKSHGWNIAGFEYMTIGGEFIAALRLESSLYL